MRNGMQRKRKTWESNNNQRYHCKNGQIGRTRASECARVWVLFTYISNMKSEVKIFRVRWRKTSLMCIRHIESTFIEDFHVTHKFKEDERKRCCGVWKKRETVHTHSAPRAMLDRETESERVAHKNCVCLMHF